jgi:hypothetical protein
VPPEFTLLKIEAPDVEVSSIKTDDLPNDWRTQLEVTRDLGTAWREKNESVLLRVPSAIVPGDRQRSLQSIPQASTKVPHQGSLLISFRPSSKDVDPIELPVYGRRSRTQTYDFHRVNLPLIGFSTTYNNREGYPKQAEVAQETSLCGTDCGTKIHATFPREIPTPRELQSG